MNGIGRPQKGGDRQLPIDLSDSLENFPVRCEPVNRSGLDVRSYLAEQRSVGYGTDRSFAQFAMEPRPSFRPVRGLHTLCDRSPRGRKPPRHLRPRNIAGPDSWYQNRSPDLAVPLLADDVGRVGPAAEIFALGKEGPRKLRTSEKRLGGQRARGNNLCEDATAFRDIHFGCGRAPHPSPGCFVEFTDGDFPHVTRCVTLIRLKARQGIRYSGAAMPRDFILR